MRVSVGCSFDWEVEAPTAAILHVEPRLDAGAILDERWDNEPAIPATTYFDAAGNRCVRMTFPDGQLRLRYDAEVEVSAEIDPADPDAVEVPPEQLPDEVLVYTLPSRYCLSDVLYDAAWEQFGSMAPGFGRVQSIADFVHAHIEFGYGSSTSVTTAADVYEAKAGVCRDFAHLMITFCRALNIPARYAFGYLPDHDVEPSTAAMDFCAWTEVYLGGRWWTFDPRNNARRAGRVLIGRGRDAVDVAMVTTFGSPFLSSMTVKADVIEAEATA